MLPFVQKTKHFVVLPHLSPTSRLPVSLYVLALAPAWLLLERAEERKLIDVKRRWIYTISIKSSKVDIASIASLSS